MESNGKPPSDEDVFTLRYPWAWQMASAVSPGPQLQAGGFTPRTSPTPIGTSINDALVKSQTDWEKAQFIFKDIWMFAESHKLKVKICSDTHKGQISWGVYISNGKKEVHGEGATIVEAYRSIWSEMLEMIGESILRRQWHKR